jgi:hypothetical protein
VVVMMMMEVARVGGQAAGAGRQVLGRAGASSNKSSRRRRPGRRRRNSARAQSGQRLARQTQVEGGCAASMHRAGRGQPTKCRTTRPTATLDDPRRSATAASQPTITRPGSWRAATALLGRPPPFAFFVVARGPVALTIELTIDIDPVTRQAMPALLARIRDMPSLGQPPSRLSPVLRPLSRPLSSVYPPVCLFVCHSACPSVYPLPPPTPTPKTTLQRLVINTNHRLLDCTTHGPPSALWPSISPSSSAPPRLHPR